MKKIIFETATAILIATVSTAASAQSSTASTIGSVTIIRPVTITKTNDLLFARIIRPSTGNGTVTLSSGADTVAVTGTGTLATGSASRAKYTINGEGAQVVSITFPATFDMTDGGANTLTVTLASDLGATTTLGSTLGTAGTAALNVGGSFPVSSTTVSAAYTGTFDVSVAYQ